MYPLCIVNKQQRVLRGRFNEHTLTLGNPYIKSKPTTAVEHFLSSSKHTPNGPRGNTFLWRHNNWFVVFIITEFLGVFLEFDEKITILHSSKV